MQEQRPIITVLLGYVVLCYSMLCHLCYYLILRLSQTVARSRSGFYLYQMEPTKFLSYLPFVLEQDKEQSTNYVKSFSMINRREVDIVQKGPKVKIVWTVCLPTYNGKAN